ncbi:transporter [Corynebacterium diphtheriae]|uniref:transporter n=1 Tax=Corynebacterium diphtheriae TaxID=1717 RepID=UPI000A1EB48A|nr:transporter [Corynebacterium diphtheriae]OSQ20839.1 transporter [Corynebacterium diphtheriae]RKX00377.1 transporter [Corynebacterium diphtheriae]
MSPTKTILRFQFRQRNRMISSNPASIMMIIFICLYGFIGLASMLFSGYDGYRKQYFAVAAIILAVGALGYIISVSVLPTGENHVNPRELAFFPLTARNILPALLLAPLLTSIGMLTVFFALTTAALGAWILPTGAAIAWVLAVVINTALTIIIGEIIRSALGTSGRTKKERINIISGLVIFMIIIAFNTLQGLDLQSEQINQAGHILMWTPLAAPAGIVIGILEGSLTTALATAALTLIYLTGAVWLWHRNITTILNEPIEKGSTTTSTRSSRVLVPWAPATPTGYIYSRALRYIRRDSRMISQLIMTPILMVFLIYKAIVDSPWALVFLVAMTALLAGMAASNDFGYDGPSNWSIIVAGVPAKNWVLARHAASLTIQSSTVLISWILLLVLFPDKGIAVAVCVSSLGALMGSAAIGLAFTVFNPFPTAAPGVNAFADRSGYSAAAFLTGFGSMLLVWIPILPGAALLIYGFSSSAALLIVAGCALCILIPGALYYLAIRKAVARVERATPEIFNKVNKFVG